MSIKRNLARSPPAIVHTTQRGKNTQTLTTNSPTVEVSRTKIIQNRNRGWFGDHTRLGRTKMRNSHPSNRVSDNDYFDAYVGVGFIGSLLLVAVGCAIFLYCWNKRRRGSPPQGSQMARTTSTANGQRSHDDVVEEISPSALLHPGEEETSSADELSHLRTRHRDGQPVRYCIIADNPESSVVPENLDNRSNESADQCTILNASIALRNDESEYNPADNRCRTMNGDHELQPVAESFKTRDDDGTNDDRVYDTDDVRSDAAADLLEASLQTDRISDVSDYLAALTLDVSSEKNDHDAQGINSVSLSSRETDDNDFSSDESFSRLQDVKAQPEFSPYHLAWSTPYYPNPRPVHRRQSETYSAAKKLDMELASKLDHGGTGAVNDEGSHYEEKLACSRKLKTFDSSGGSTCSDSSVTSGWAFLKPEDARCRPVSAEYCTPRPPSTKTQRRSVGALNLLGADGEVPERERQPLLAYSVEEYRRSLKNIAVDPPKASPKKRRSGSDSSSSSSSSVSPLSCANLPCPLSESAVCRTSLGSLSVFPVSRNNEEWEGPEQTPPNPPSEVRSSLDNSLADLGDITGSREGNANDAAPSMSRADGGKREDDEVVQDAFNNNDDNVTKSSGSSLLSPAGSSAPPSTASPSSANSREAMSSSAEKTSNVYDDLSPGDPSAQPSITEADETGEVHVATLTGQPTPTGSSSVQPQLSSGFDNFKPPYPVDNPMLVSSSTCSLWTNKDAARPAIPRSRSSSSRPLSHGTLLDAANQPALRRSKTSESISHSAQNLQQPMSVGSWSDISVAGSSASRMSLQDNSLTWDNEFSSSVRITASESLIWEDDPYLN